MKYFLFTRDGKTQPQITVVNAEGSSYPLRHVVKHSPTGMEWGYGGSGPSDTARSVLFDVLGDGCRDEIDGLYMAFKFAFITTLSHGAQTQIINERDIQEWLSMERYVLRTNLEAFNEQSHP